MGGSGGGLLLACLLLRATPCALAVTPEVWVTIPSNASDLAAALSLASLLSGSPPVGIGVDPTVATLSGPGNCGLTIGPQVAVVAGPATFTCTGGGHPPPFVIAADSTTAFFDITWQGCEPGGTVRVSQHASPSFTRCQWLDNVGLRGPGVWVFGDGSASTPPSVITFTDSAFIGNRADKALTDGLGLEGNGGALFSVDASVTFRCVRCSFARNTAGNDGGCFYGSGRMEAHNSTFLYNSATRGGATFTLSKGDHNGGLLAYDCSFEGQEATGSGAAVGAFDHSIVVLHRCTVARSRPRALSSRFNAPISLHGAGTASFVNSSFLHNPLAPLYFRSGRQANVSGCVMAHNTGHSAASLDVAGAQVSVVDTIMAHNAVSSFGGCATVSTGAHVSWTRVVCLHTSAGVVGAGVTAFSTAVAHIRDSVIAGVSASLGAAAVYAREDSVVDITGSLLSEADAAGANGGAFVQLERTRMSLTDTTVLGLSSAVAALSILEQSAVVTVTRSRVANATASSLLTLNSPDTAAHIAGCLFDGGVFVGLTGLLEEGHAFQLAPGAFLNMSSSAVSDTVGPTVETGLAATFLGHRLTWTRNIGPVLTGRGRAVLDSCTVRQHDAGPGAPPLPLLYVFELAEVSLRGCTFSDILAGGGLIAVTRGGTVQSNACAFLRIRGPAVSCTGNPGGIFNSTRDLFAHHTAAAPESGGALRAAGLCIVTLHAATFVNNTAEVSGGAVYFVGVAGSRLAVGTGTVFHHNTAGAAGGAVYLSDATAAATTISDTTFRGCVARDAGGAVFFPGGQAAVDLPALVPPVHFINNSALYGPDMATGMVEVAQQGAVTAHPISGQLSVITVAGEDAFGSRFVTLGFDPVLLIRGVVGAAGSLRGSLTASGQLGVTSFQTVGLEGVNPNQTVALDVVALSPADRPLQVQILVEVPGCPPGYVPPSASFSAATTTSSICVPCPAGLRGGGPFGGCVDCTPGFFSSSGAVQCQACPAGRFSGPVAARCDACPAGTAASHNATAEQCPVCPPGTVQPATGQSACRVCGPGSSSPAHALGCVECQPGFFAGRKSPLCHPCPPLSVAPGPGAGECSPCPPGHVVRDDSCQPCAVGRFLQPNSTVNDCRDAAPGRYVPQPAATTAALCPAGTLSTGRAAATCTLCPSGRFCLPGASACKDCAAGLRCEFGAITVMEGYWSPSLLLLRPNTSDLLGATLWRCPYSGTCEAAGNNSISCAPGFQGTLCGECAPGWAPLGSGGGTCVPCPPAVVDGILSVVIIAGVLGVLAAVTYHKAHPKASTLTPSARSTTPSPTAVVRLGVTFLQQLHTLMSFTINGPRSARIATSVASDAANGFQLTTPPLQCVFGYTFAQRLYITVALPPITVGTVVAMHCAIDVVRRRRRQQPAASDRLALLRRRQSLRTAATASTVFTLFLLYSSVTRVVLSVFGPQVPVEDTRVLQSAVEVSAKGGQFSALVAVAALGLLVYGLGVPLSAAWLLWRRRLFLNSVDFKRSGLTFLTQGYRRGVEWLWEAQILLRKLVLVAVGVGVADSVTQLALGQLVLVAALVAHVAVQPYEQAGLNHLESACLCSLLVTAWANMLHWRHQQEAATATLAATVILAVNLATVAALGTAAVVWARRRPPATTEGEAAALRPALAATVNPLVLQRAGGRGASGHAAELSAITKGRRITRVDGRASPLPQRVGRGGRDK